MQNQIENDGGEDKTIDTLSIRNKDITTVLEKLKDELRKIKADHREDREEVEKLIWKDVTV